MSEWRTISDEPIYKISSEGEVYNTVTGKTLKPRISHGYNYVTLCGENGHRQVRVHRLVAKEFIPNVLGKPLINHIDGNKTNNNVENLEWCTASENMKHAYRTGLQKPIPEQIDDSLSRAITKRRTRVRNVDTGECYSSVVECANSVGLSRSAISMHLTGQNKHPRFEYAD